MLIVEIFNVSAMWRFISALLGLRSVIKRAGFSSHKKNNLFALTEFELILGIHTYYTLIDDLINLQSISYFKFFAKLANIYNC